MALTHWLLFFHLLGAFAVFAGMGIAGTLQLAALRRDRPSEILALLQLTRTGVVLVMVGMTLTLGFGIGLAEHLGLGLSPAWLQAALGLWIASMVLGGLGGRTARKARELAERLAAEGDAVSQELRSLLAHRPSLWLSYLSSILIVAIVVLMVWRPT